MRRLLVLAALVLAYPGHAQPVFIGLGDLPGGQFSSTARAVSADGSVVVGESITASGPEAFRWTQAGGILGLGRLAGGMSSSAYGVSADGSVVVGNGPGAFRWTEAAGMEPLLDSALLGSGEEVYGVSADGATIVGRRSYFDQHEGVSQASAWTEPTGWFPLGLWGRDYGIAYAASADGSVIVGSGDESNVVRWTEATGAVVLAAGGNSAATDISADGSAIVGQTFFPSDFASEDHAFRWTQATGVVRLREGANLYSSGATGVSADGSVIVGFDGASPFIWDATRGMRSIDQFFVSVGLIHPGWTLTHATSISDDGNTIIGDGINPSGQREAWVAVIPRPCGNGIDDDSDGLIDFDGGASANGGIPIGPLDPGCRDGLHSSTEGPKCQDGLDNDGDGKIDFDGGALANGGVALGSPDPQCVEPWRNSERASPACGLSAELALVIPLLHLAASRRRHAS